MTEVADQLLALSQIRRCGVDAGELEGFADPRARRVRVAKAHVIGAGDSSEDFVRARLSGLLDQDALQQLVRAKLLLVGVVGQFSKRILEGQVLHCCMPESLPGW